MAADELSADVDHRPRCSSADTVSASPHHPSLRADNIALPDETDAAVHKSDESVTPTKVVEEVDAVANNTNSVGFDSCKPGSDSSHEQQPRCAGEVVCDDVSDENVCSPAAGDVGTPPPPPRASVLPPDSALDTDDSLQPLATAVGAADDDVDYVRMVVCEPTAEPSASEQRSGVTAAERCRKDAAGQEELDGVERTVEASDGDLMEESVGTEEPVLTATAAAADDDDDMRMPSATGDSLQLVSTRPEDTVSLRQPTDMPPCEPGTVPDSNHGPLDTERTQAVDSVGVGEVADVSCDAVVANTCPTESTQSCTDSRATFTAASVPSQASDLHHVVQMSSLSEPNLLRGNGETTADVDTVFVSSSEDRWRPVDFTLGELTLTGSSSTAAGVLRRCSLDVSGRGLSLLSRIAEETVAAAPGLEQTPDVQHDQHDIQQQYVASGEYQRRSILALDRQRIGQRLFTLWHTASLYCRHVTSG